MKNPYWYLVLIRNPNKLLLSGAFLLLTISCYSQNHLENWNSLQLNLALSKKLEMRLVHLRSYNLSRNYSNEFNQSAVSFDYDFTKRVSVSTGVVLGSLSAADGANRLLVRGTYRLPIADVLNWSNSLQAEVHSANETRYRYRIIYNTRISPRRRLNFLRLSPSVAYSLFYNIGGNEIQYFDKEGDPVVSQSPDGFHRGRLFLNLNSKISQNLSVAVYYMMQREFNFLSNEYNKMNIVNPTTSRTVRPFDDYNVIGATLSLNFDAYKKRNQKGKRKSK